MAKTATATQANKVAKKAKTRTPKTRTLELGKTAGRFFDKLAEARQQRLSAERIEKLNKGAIQELYIDSTTKMKVDDQLVLTVDNEIRGRVTCTHGGKAVDLDLLLEGWPEAFEACVKDTTQLRFSPA